VSQTKPACGHSDCSVSSGIFGSLTFGRGELDEHGLWEIPCDLCARAHEQAHPEEEACWPFKRDTLVDCPVEAEDAQEQLLKAVAHFLSDLGGTFDQPCASAAAINKLYRAWDDYQAIAQAKKGASQ
jgi:hypothetical protein